MSTVPDEVHLARQRVERGQRASGDEALRVTIEELDARLTAELAKLAKKTTAKIEGKVVDASALASFIQRVKVEAGFALAEQITALEARVGENFSAYNETITVLTDAVHTEATKTETLISHFGRANAEFADTIHTYASAAQALAERTTELESTLTADGTGLLARVSQVETTKVNAAGARAEASTVVSASLSSLAPGSIGAAVASVSAVAEAAADATGFLSGKYTLKVVAGNIVTGMTVTSTTGIPGVPDTSEVAFQAAVFKIHDGTSAVAPFVVSGGVVQMANATVTGTLDIGAAYARTRIDTSGVVFGYGQSQRLALEYAGFTSALNHYASHHNVSSLYASTSASIDTAQLVLRAYLSGSVSAAATYSPTGIEGGTGPITIGPGLVVSAGDLDASGVAVLAGSLAVSGAATFSSGFHAVGSCVISFGGLSVTNQISTSAAVQTGGGALGPVSGRHELSAGGSNSIAFATSGTQRWIVGGGDGHLKALGAYDLRKASADGWTPMLHDGANPIEMQWSGGKIRFRVGGSDVGGVTPA
jgi:hypothetical protein